MRVLGFEIQIRRADESEPPQRRTTLDQLFVRWAPRLFASFGVGVAATVLLVLMLNPIFRFGYPYEPEALMFSGGLMAAFALGLHRLGRAAPVVAGLMMAALVTAMGWGSIGVEEALMIVGMALATASVSGVDQLIFGRRRTRAAETELRDRLRPTTTVEREETAPRVNS